MGSCLRFRFRRKQNRGASAWAYLTMSSNEVKKRTCRIYNATCRRAAAMAENRALLYYASGLRIDAPRREDDTQPRARHAERGRRVDRLAGPGGRPPLGRLSARPGVER